MGISILILTRNEEQDLPACLQSVGWSNDVHVLDSFSSDRTVDIAKAAGAHVTQRKFDNWASHQNWACSNIAFRNPWVLYIDADERVGQELREALIRRALPEAPESAFRIRRRDFFIDGSWLKRTQFSQLFIRLFRPQCIQYQRLVNPITHVTGIVGDLSGHLDHYPFSKGIGFWMERHIKYADFEARMLMEERHSTKPSLRRALFSSDFHERRRHQKWLFQRMPFRPALKLGYLFFIRRAFLDGRAGISHALLQAMYEYLIVLRSRELAARAPAKEVTAPPQPICLPIPRTAHTRQPKPDFPQRDRDLTETSQR